ncbi:MAG: sugar transferase [Acidimicrobiales bacterium]|nr:sugar transferase [Acidimicrobiales bacterium]
MNWWLRVRSVLDRVVAAVLLVPLAPVMAVLSYRIRRYDGGPGMITVPRVGRDGREFGMWKLRSMRVEDPSGMAGGVRLTGEDDDRITPIGVRLRAYYLDEMPQLVNVVRGEMALLGPRPEAPEFVDDSEGWREVLSMRPGIAGPTQLVVNNWEREVITADPTGETYTEEVVPVKLAIDGWYVRRSSPKLDALVAITLLRRFMPGTGSYTLKKVVRREVPATVAVEELRTFAPAVLGAESAA